MSKAEELAKEYAEKFILTVDHQSDVEEAYIDGYHQAEEDLALSLEDIELISNILLDVFITTKEDDTPRKEKYEKVLKRFMMERNKV